MRSRPSARLLIIDRAGRLLLFRFVHRKGALSGQDYWATPGGGVEPGEIFEDAAFRELREETGIVVDSLGPEIGRNQFELQLPDGETVMADERYFVIKPGDPSLSRDGWSGEEVEVLVEHKWWSYAELSATASTVWPQNILELLTTAISG